MYKEFKAKESTKAVGESLEQHCLESFNIYRNQALITTGTKITFGKDNKVSKELFEKMDELVDKPKLTNEIIQKKRLFKTIFN